MCRSLLLGCLGGLLTLLAACGTTSGIRAPEGAPKDAQPASLAGFERVVVADFEDATKEQSTQSKNAAREFPDLIVQQVRASGAFPTVERSGASAAGTLQITGKVTRYSEGNAAARALIGLGAGSSYFDALVELRDAATGSLIGSMEVDKNSWPLGGLIASTQTPRTFMQGAATKVAEELKRRRGSSTGSPQ